MKSLIHTSTDGYKYRYQLPDQFTGEDTEGAQGANDKIKLGVPENYINLSKVNWADFRRTLHNALVTNNLLTLTDIRSDVGNRKFQQIVSKIVSEEILRQLSLGV